MNSFEAGYPDGKIWVELQQMAEQDADVRRYLDYLEAREKEWAEDKPRPHPDLKTALQAPHQRSILHRLAQKLEAADLLPLAERLLIEKNKNVRENLLCIFSQCPYPLDYQPLLAMVRQETYSLTRRHATWALKHLQAPEIREFALQKLRRAVRPYYYTDILISNYQPSDASLLASVVARFQSEYVIEWLAISYLEIYQANPTPECAAPLLALYGKLTCGLHREEVVEMLIAQNVLPDWLNKELRYDSYEPIRRLHRPR